MSQTINHIVVTYGGGETLEYVFNAITLVFKDKEFNWALYISAILCGFWVIINSITKGDGFIPFKWFFWFLLSTQLILHPKTTIKIVDPLTKFERVVQNVPYVLGAFAATTSSVGDVLTRKIEAFFNLPDDNLLYHKTGHVFASKLFRQMGQYKINDGVLKANLHRFIQNCVVYDAMVGYQYNLHDLQTDPDILSLVSNTSTIVGFTYQDNDGTGSIVSCKAGIERIKEQLKTEVDTIASKMGKKVGLGKSQNGLSKSDTIARNEFKVALSSTYEFMTGISQTADELLKQEMMINAIQDASKNKAEELGSPHNYAASKAILQQRSTYNVVGEIAANSLVVTKVVFEILVYSAFIFVAMMVMMPNGLQTLGSYLGVIAWIQLWAPLYGIFNLIMNVSAKYRSEGIISDGGLTMLTSVGFSNLHADIEALAGWFSMSIPFISYAIVKGGVASFMNLASSLGHGFQSAAASASSEVVSGNLSMRNLSYANSSMHSFSGFKHDSNLGFQSGRMDVSNDDGSVSFMNAGGASGFRAGAGLTTSTWDHRLGISGHLSSQNTQNLQQERSVMAGLSNEHSTAESQAMRQASTLLERMGKSGAQNRAWSVGGGTDQSVGVSQTLSFMNELQERYGYNSGQAAEVAASIGIGNGVIGASGKFSSTADYHDAINKGKQLADSQGYTESLQKTLRHTDQIAFNENEQFEKGLAKDVSSSFDRMSQLRDSISVSEQKLERLSSNQSFIDTQGANIEMEGNQKLIDYIARQKNNISGEFGGKVQEIGQAGAQKIARVKGDEYYSYLQGFYRDVVPQMLDNIPTAKSTGLDKSSFNQVRADREFNGGEVASANTVQTANSNNVISQDNSQTNLEGQSNTQTTQSGSGSTYSSSNSDNNSIAKGAKDWQAIPSKFASDLNKPETRVEQTQQAVMESTKQKEISSSALDKMTVKLHNYDNMKQQAVEQVNAPPTKTYKETTQTIDKAQDGFDARFDNNFNTNVQSLSKATDVKPIDDKGIIADVNKHYIDTTSVASQKQMARTQDKAELQGTYDKNENKFQIERAVDNTWQNTRKGHDKKTGNEEVIKDLQKKDNK